jgi:hypothetical protein
MKNRIQELRKELKKLNGLQWAKKRQLRDAVWRDSRKSISRLTKDMNSRKYEIRRRESEIEMIKMAASKMACFQGDQVGQIFVIHAHGHKGPDGSFYQEDIWANNYFLEDGKYRFRGGSMRVHGDFDEVVKEMLADGHVQVNVKDEEFHQ